MKIDYFFINFLKLLMLYNYLVTTPIALVATSEVTTKSDDVTYFIAYNNNNNNNNDDEYNNNLSIDRMHSNLNSSENIDLLVKREVKQEDNISDNYAIYRQTSTTTIYKHTSVYFRENFSNDDIFDIDLSNTGTSVENLTVTSTIGTLISVSKFKIDDDDDDDDDNDDNNNDHNRVLRNLFKSIIFLPIIVMTLIGNMLVILAVVIVRKLHTQDNANNFLIVSLAVSDFLVGVLVMPFAFYVELSNENKWYLGAILCDLWTLSDVLLCTASILNLCAISIDRYFIILHAMVYTQQRNSKLMLLMILVVWLLSALISIPPLFGWGKPSARLEIDNNCAVSSDWKYQIYASLLAFYLPLIVMIIIYINIYQAARKIKKREMETAGRLQFTMPSLSYSPDSLPNIKSQMEPLISSNSVNNHFLNQQTSVQSNNYVYRTKNSTCSSSSIPPPLILANGGSNLSNQLNLSPNDNGKKKTKIVNTTSHQIVATLKKSSRSDSEGGASIESKIYHSSTSSQDNLSSLNQNGQTQQAGMLSPTLMIVSSSSTHHGSSHVTVNAIGNGSSSSRRSSFGRKFGRRLTQAFAGIKRNSGASSSHGKNQKATRTLGVIMGCFILCWLPFFILAVVKPIGLKNGKFIRDYIPKWLDSLLLWLGYFNSALNPMIYARFNREFRRPFIEILCFRCRGINDKLRDEERRKMYLDNTASLHAQTSLGQFSDKFRKNSNISNSHLLQSESYAMRCSNQNNINIVINPMQNQNENDLDVDQYKPGLAATKEVNDDEHSSSSITIIDYKQQIQRQRNKFFYGTEKPPHLSSNTDININFDQKLDETFKSTQTTFGAETFINIDSNKLNNNIDESTPTSNRSTRSNKSRSLKRQSRPILIDTSVESFCDILNSDKKVKSHPTSNDITLKGAESINLDKNSEQNRFGDEIINEEESNAKLAPTFSFANTMSSSQSNYSTPQMITSPSVDSSKEIKLEETIEELIFNNDQLEELQNFSSIDNRQKLNNSSTKSSIFTNDESSLPFQSTSSIFQQLEQSISSILTSSSVPKHLIKSIQTSVNNSPTTTNILAGMHNATSASSSFSNYKLKNTSNNSIPFSSVYSFITAPTSPVNLNDTVVFSSDDDLENPNHYNICETKTDDDDDEQKTDAALLNEKDLTNNNNKNNEARKYDINNDNLTLKPIPNKSKTSRQRKLLISKQQNQSNEETSRRNVSAIQLSKLTTGNNQKSLPLSSSSHVPLAYCTHNKKSSSKSAWSPTPRHKYNRNIKTNELGVDMNEHTEDGLMKLRETNNTNNLCINKSTSLQATQVVNNNNNNNINNNSTNCSTNVSLKTTASETSV